jgi:hypothetical protein
MARTSFFRKKPKANPEIDGCRSTCDTCHVAQLCGGCTGLCRFDSHKSQCPQTCHECPARCWRRSDLDEWEFDINGFQLDEVTCNLRFSGDLPFYLPQVREKIWNIYHPAYIINIAKLMNPQTKKLLYLGGAPAVNSLRKRWQIPQESKLVLSFCCKDEYIDHIWAHQFEEWSPGKDFWQTVATYSFDAALSVDYSCFLNYPRLDHLTNIKRNVLSAQRLALGGTPVVLDVMIYNMHDLERLVAWGAREGFQWYHLNFQKTYKVPWMKDIITQRCDRILELVPQAKFIISGIGDVERILFFTSRYPGRVALSSANVSIHSNCGRIYDPNSEQWIKSLLGHQQLFQTNLKHFASLL